jgi:glutathione reductase (NADPH)
LADLDLFVLGGGSGGVACARRAASHGARVAIAEHSRVGGTCVIRGCVPKKLMSYGAHFADFFRMAPAYGWDVGTPPLQFATLLENRNREIARLNGIYIGMLERAGVRLVEGKARILGRRDGTFLIEAAGTQFSAARVVLAAGATPSIPDIPGKDLAVTSDELLEDIYDYPRRLAVVGAGYIGLEQSSIFLGLGCETHLVLRRDLPLAGFDGDLRRELTNQLEASGMRIHRSVQTTAIERADGGLVVQTSGGPIQVDKVLLATGRAPRPNTSGIGLDELGVRLNRNGAVMVDEAYESNVEGLLAIGDCSDHGFGCRPAIPGKELGLSSGQFDLTPVAIAEGRAIAERLYNANPSSVSYRIVPTSVFAIPQAASVGLAEERARELGYDVAIYKTRFRPMLYTLPNLVDLAGEERTLMKLVVDKATDKVLGCHMVGDDAAEIIQCLAVALTAGATKAEFDATMAMHPTAAEEFVTLYQPAGE